jgi:hypothetical protein
MMLLPTWESASGGETREGATRSKRDALIGAARQGAQMAGQIARDALSALELDFLACRLSLDSDS